MFVGQFGRLIFQAIHFVEKVQRFGERETIGPEAEVDPAVEVFVEILRLVCRPYVFTASLPPSVVHTAATSIRKLMHAGNKRAHLWENSRVLHQGLRDAGFQLGTQEAQSAIIAVIMPDLERGAAMWEALLHEGLYVNLARPPATPANMTLLRCSLCAEHTAEQVQTIIGMFKRAGAAVGII